MFHIEQTKISTKSVYKNKELSLIGQNFLDKLNPIYLIANQQNSNSSQAYKYFNTI